MCPRLARTGVARPGGQQQRGGNRGVRIRTADYELELAWNRFRM